MRRNSVRKFIHAVLDCLPLMVIPIFAIYSQNHEINDQSITVTENKVVDFNQLFENGLIEDTEGYTALNGTISLQDDVMTLTPTSAQQLFRTRIEYRYITPVVNHKYYFRAQMYCNKSVYGGAYISGIGGTNNYQQFNGNTWYSYEFINTATVSTPQPVYFGNEWDMATTNTFSVTNINIFDLTQMFGAGNEPTIEQFKQFFPLSYYEYTLSEEVIIENYTTQTYEDTDIMSQFMYVTYNAVDKYFNMNRVFNLDGIWNWISNTLFGGQPSISAYIVYNIIAYEFIMDIIFLIYLVLMFVIDFAENCIDRFTKRGTK